MRAGALPGSADVWFHDCVDLISPARRGLQAHEGLGVELLALLRLRLILLPEGAHSLTHHRAPQGL